jgi:hypothetical protein
MAEALTSRVAAYKSCPDLLRVDRLSAGEVSDLDIAVTDNNGCLLDMTSVDGGAGDPAYYDEEGNLVPPLPADGALPQHWWGEYVARPAYWTDHGLLRFPLAVIDAGAGKFRLRVRRRNIPPGVYIAEASFYAPGRVLRLRERRWLEVEPTLRFLNKGPITEQEVRLALRDYECFNEFLKREESTPNEIMFAIRRPVDIWNETPPFIVPHTVTTFPYRENWLQAAIGFLLRSHAAHRRRNELTVSSDTIQMRDNDKHDIYEQSGERMVGEYREWVRTAKVTINVNMGFGQLHSPYSSLVRRW